MDFEDSGGGSIIMKSRICYGPKISSTCSAETNNAFIVTMTERTIMNRGSRRIEVPTRIDLSSVR